MIPILKAKALHHPKLPLQPQLRQPMPSDSQACGSPQFGNCGDVSDVVREDMGTVCKQRQPYSAGQYDKYPQEDREDPDGSDVHYHDPACGLPHA